MKKITIITGHYGSGKTNLAVNLALQLADAGEKVTIVDFDIVNPYFRTADFAKLFAEHGVTLAASMYANTSLDIPAISFDMERMAYEPGYLIVDVGGDDAGAIGLGRYAEGFAAYAPDQLDMWYVVNRYRYLTEEPQETLELMYEIEAVSRMRHTGIVNNSNLGRETTAETILQAMPYAEEIAKQAKNLGIEMLVMDDGWFGHRNDDKSSLGDWFVNEDKIKGGLKHLVDEVNKIGLKFGIWFEPEMISPDSKLYAEHQDWCIHIPGRHRTTVRSQLVLDFSRKEVRDYIYEQMKAILSSANIEYVKWDMNRQLSEVGNEVFPPERQREIWHRYVLGVYEMQERLLTDFPDLLLENCAGGGSRFDAGMLYYSPQIWTSDDTDAIERLKIQYGTSMCYPCSCFGAHVSDSPNHCVGRITPFETRGHVAMSGTFGYELDVTKISDDDKYAIKEQIAEFNKYNPLVRTGDYYRIGDPFANDRFDAWQFVAKDKSETLLEYVQVLKEPSVFLHRVKLKGLEKGCYYRHEQTGRVYSAELLMNSGFDIPSLWGDFRSFIAHFVRVK